MTDLDQKARNILISGIMLIAIALGISRFAYTPILPSMQQAFGFDDGFAGFLGSANYVGYLLGSIWASVTPNLADRNRRIRWNLIVTMICTASMGMVSNPTYWLMIRLVAGITSAIVFIFASGLVLEKLAELNRQAWFGWLYSGVGLGIVLSAITIPFLTAYAGWRAGWIGMAVVGWLLFLISCTEHNKGQQRRVSPGNLTKDENTVAKKILPWLAISYGLVGLGYIVTGTFLISLAERAFDHIRIGGFVWFFVGMAVIPSCPFWTAIGKKHGFVNTLIITQIVQAIGIILPIWSTGYFGIFMGAICFGGTFVGIAALTVIIGRQADPQNASRNIAILTAAFGFGQMLGPWIAGKMAVHKDGLAIPLYCASLTVVLATISLTAGLYFSKTKKPIAF